jgi:phage shock protein A
MRALWGNLALAGYVSVLEGENASMASILQKVNTLISANVHAMIDRAIESNSVKIMDEYIRRAERDLEELEDTAAAVGGTVKTLKRKYDEFVAQIEKLDRDIDTLLVKGKNELAIAAQADLNSRQKIAEEYRVQFEAQEDEYKRILDARVKLEARLNMIRQQRERMIALIELTAARRQTTQVVRSIDDLVNLGDEDVRNLSESILSELDQAEAEAEMVSSRLYNQVEEAIGQSEVEIQLDERRKRLGLQEGE